MAGPELPVGDIANELRLMDAAMLNYRLSYQNFYIATQNGDWQAAERHRLAVISYIESAMDAYSRACRSQLRTT